MFRGKSFYNSLYLRDLTLSLTPLWGLVSFLRAQHTGKDFNYQPNNKEAMVFGD